MNDLLRRSLLYVSAFSKAMLRKAPSRGADAIIVDLEDAAREGRGVATVDGEMVEGPSTGPRPGAPSPARAGPAPPEGTTLNRSAHETPSWFWP
jgi:hypothetical protein